VRAADWEAGYLMEPLYEKFEWFTGKG
jgi:hypothetical protein